MPRVSALPSRGLFLSVMSPFLVCGSSAMDVSHKPRARYHFLRVASILWAGDVTAIKLCLD